MRKTSGLILSALILMLTAGRPVWAASKSGSSTATFLRLEQGARALGMGGAFVAVSDDVHSLWWNPAGLVRSKFQELTISHTQFIEDVNSQFAGFKMPLKGKKASVGASLLYFNVPGIEGYDANGNATGDLEANAYSGALSYSKAMDTRLSFGANVKLISQKLASESGQGFAADFGLQIWQKPLALGLGLYNVGPKLSIGGFSNSLPLNLRVGLGYYFAKDMVFAADFEKPNDADSKFHLGAEWKIRSNLGLRAGYQNLKDLGSAGWTLGLNVVQLWWQQPQGEAAPVFKEDNLEEMVGGEAKALISIDYAFVSYGDLDATHRLTLSFKF